MQRLYFLLVISLIGLLTGCKKNCGPAGEPRLELSLTMQAGNGLTEIYALNALTNAPVITLPQSTSAPNRIYWQVELPLSIKSDRTQYVLVSSTRRDTLTVNYRRVFTYEDTECGYMVDINPPLSNTGSILPRTAIVQTTSGMVNDVQFKDTVTGVIFSRPRSDTGIYISLSF